MTGLRFESGFGPFFWPRMTNKDVFFGSLDMQKHHLKRFGHILAGVAFMIFEPKGKGA